MPAENKNSPRKVVIRKYENRRLYDATNSRYINLEEVAEMVRAGYDVQVVDAATGEDLTRLILTQIIAEHAKGPNSTFPLDVLRQMVVASGRATQESTLKYMKAVLDMYQNAFRAIQPPLSPFEFIPRAAVPQPPPASAYPPAPETASPEVDELKRRVAELESMVTTLGPKKARKKATAKNRKRP